MAAIRSRGNKDTELKLASILRASGITGWRRHQPLPGHPDFIFRHARLAVFVDGCFWHGCPSTAASQAATAPTGSPNSAATARATPPSNASSAPQAGPSSGRISATRARFQCEESRTDGLCWS